MIFKHINSQNILFPNQPEHLKIFIIQIDKIPVFIIQLYPDGDILVYITQQTFTPVQRLVGREGIGHIRKHQHDLILTRRIHHGMKIFIFLIQMIIYIPYNPVSHHPFQIRQPFHKMRINFTSIFPGPTIPSRVVKNLSHRVRIHEIIILHVSFLIIKQFHPHVPHRHMFKQISQKFFLFLCLILRLPEFHANTDNIHHRGKPLVILIFPHVRLIQDVDTGIPGHSVF